MYDNSIFIKTHVTGGVDKWRDFLIQGSLAKYQAKLISDSFENVSEKQIAMYYNVGNKINNSLVNGFSDTISTIKQKSDEIVSSIRQSSDEIVSSIRQSSAEVVFSINKMNQTLSNHLLEIGQGLVLLNHQQSITNEMLVNIQELLSIPEIEKERMMNIQFGLKFLRGANEDKSLYADALSYFEKAHNQFPQDWFTTYYLGLIRLFSADNLEVNKAEQMFLDTKKYLSIDSKIENSKINVLVKKYFVDGNINTKGTKLILAECCNNLATISQIQNNSESAFKYAKQAITFSTDPKYKYYAAKYAIKLKKENDSIDLLNQAVDSLPIYAETILTDLDFNLNTTVLNFLLEKRTSLDKELIIITEALNIYHEEARKINNLIKDSSYHLSIPISYNKTKNDILKMPYIDACNELKKIKRIIGNEITIKNIKKYFPQTCGIFNRIEETIIGYDSSLLLDSINKEGEAYIKFNKKSELEHLQNLKILENKKKWIKESKEKELKEKELKELKEKELKEKELKELKEKKLKEKIDKLTTIAIYGGSAGMVIFAIIANEIGLALNEQGIKLGEFKTFYFLVMYFFGFYLGFKITKKILIKLFVQLNSEK